MNNPKDNILPKVAEVIIVEGRDDTQAIRRAVRAVTIETHGFGISKNTWDKIECAHRDYGIIVFTDPDHAGEEIRKKINEKYPDAKQAFLSREKASEKRNQTYTDIGIENAAPEDIREALEKARARVLIDEEACDTDKEFTMSDLESAGLTGGDGAKNRREKLGDILGIGYANAKGLLYKLNTLGIERSAFDEAIKRIK